MDSTQMQQAVMDSLESGISFPQEMANNILQPDSMNNINEEVSSIKAPPLSYDELFPELPNSGTTTEDRNASINTWSRNSDMRIASSVITQVFRVPFEERAKIDESTQFGESISSRICADITAKTGAHIEISIAKNQSLTFLITGKNCEVLKAKALAIEKFQQPARQVIKIPQEHYKFILGKRGKKLQELEELTGTKISIPNANDPSDEIVVRGIKDGIEKAIHEIQLISDEQSKQAREVIDIPKVYHPFVNPSANRDIGRIVAESSVRVNMPPSFSEKTEISIVGDKDGVHLCKEIMSNLHDELAKKCQTVSVEVPKDQHKYVSGPKRSNIDEILLKYNVSVELPTNDSSPDTITLRGPQEKLGNALTAVYHYANSCGVEYVSCPLWLHRYVIGKSGSKIKEITQEFQKANVELSENDTIKIEGPKEDVEKVKKKLEDFVGDLQRSHAMEEISVDPKFYSFIIGKNGGTIRRLRTDHQVNISIDDNNVRNVLKIDGPKEQVESAKVELKEMISKLENEREKDIRIEPRLHRLLIGPKGEKIREIRDKFNQVNVIFPDSDSDIVKIKGYKDDVERCYRYLSKYSKDLLEENYQIKFSIYRQFHKYIIGKSGANIKKVYEETNVRINLQDDGDEVTLTGRKENCEKAKQMLEKFQNEMENISDIDVIIPSKFHKNLIGSEGKLIRSISEQCGGVFIKFPMPESKSDKVNIRGPKEDCLKAKTMLLEMSNEKQLASCVAEVRAKPEFHRFLIGRNGSNIRQIRERTGTQIIFPNSSDSVKDVITIIGKKENVEKAQKEIESAVKELDKTTEEWVYIDPAYHRHFMTRKAELLRDISDQHGGVRISFPKIGDTESSILIKGVKEGVVGAKERLLEIVEDLKAEVVEEVEIPQKYHRNLVGPRGSNVMAVMAKFNVHIKFPDRDNGEGHAMTNGASEGPRPQDMIQIRGRKEKCLAAKQALIDSIPIEDQVIVPFKYHRYIIGPSGAFVRAIMDDFDVQINVPSVNDHSDVILITGPPSNVEKAKEAIEKKRDEAIADEEDKVLRRFQLSLNIDPEFHPRIIGRKGTVVSKLRTKYDVGIHFPERGSSDPDLITIVGYEKNCHEAREAILKITGDPENMVRKSIEVDSRVHSRLIGARGRNIRKMMDEYKVEIKFPRDGEDPNVVVIMGKPESVDECADQLLNLTEEYLQDIYEQQEAQKFIVPSSKSLQNAENDLNNQTDDHGFVVSGAPWAQSAPKLDSSEDFPSMGSVSTPSSAPMWGPRRK